MISIKNRNHIMKKPKIKSSQQITLHRDRTVSFFSILTSSWMRVPAIDIKPSELATMTCRDRNGITRLSN
jgi:hypothetical protein